MKLLSSIQRETAGKSALKLAALPVAMLYGAMFNFACASIPIIGQGPHGMLWALMIGWVTFLWVLRVLNDHASRQSPEFFNKPAKIVAIAFVALPFCVLAGRLIFSFVPFIWSDTVGAFVGYFVALRIPPILLARRTDEKSEVERGTRIVRSEEAISESPSQATPQLEGETFRWAGNTHPAHVAEGGLLVVGARGTGKTLQVREHMGSWLPTIRPGSGRFAIIDDVKAELISFLVSLRLLCEYLIMNPYDKRCWAWDLAADIQSPSEAKQFVEVLFPEPSHAESKHWTSSARDIVAGIINAFNERRPGDWTLRDLVCVSTFKERMEPLLAGTDLKNYYEPRTTFLNTLNTIRTELGALEPVAALNDRTPPERRVSLKELVRKKDRIVVLGGHENLQATLAPINRLIFRQLTDALTAEPDMPTENRFLFYSDEARHGGRLDLSRFINLRSRGGRCVLGFQDLEGLYTVFGKNAAMEIVGAFSSISVLKVNEVGTAKWASDRIGEAFVIEDLEDPRPDDGGERKLHRSRVKREAVLPSEIMNLRTFRDGRVEGVHRFLGTDDAIHKIVRYPFHKKDPKLDFQRRPKEEEVLRKWTPEDQKRFESKSPKNKPSNGKGRKPKSPPSDLDSFGRFEF